MSGKSLFRVKAAVKTQKTHMVQSGAHENKRYMVKIPHPHNTACLSSSIVSFAHSKNSFFQKKKIAHMHTQNNKLTVLLHALKELNNHL
mmetsp:Transcript_29996/g.69187  ORF Transcript_29996/g.69187 Transcript_29996/m.69187 type:complete len:89 (+) Transcript_29996:40-306(+)